MDKNTLQCLKENDSNALRLLFDKYYEAMVRYAIFHLNDIAPSEEIVQDIFIYIWEKRDSLNIETSLESYMYKSVRNRCLNYLKSKTYRMQKVSDPENVLMNSKAAETDRIETRELEELLAQAIAALPEKSAVIFNYSRSMGFTHSEIAKIMDISIKTVEYHVGNAMKFIKAHLEKFGYLLLLLFLR